MEPQALKNSSEASDDFKDQSRSAQCWKTSEGQRENSGANQDLEKLLQEIQRKSLQLQIISEQDGHHISSKAALGLFAEIMRKYELELSIKNSLVEKYQEEFPKVISEKQERILELERQKQEKYEQSKVMVARLIAEKKEKEELASSFRMYRDMNQKQIGDVKRQLKQKMAAIKELTGKVSQLEKQSEVPLKTCDPSPSPLTASSSQSLSSSKELAAVIEEKSAQIQRLEELRQIKYEESKQLVARLITEKKQKESLRESFDLYKEMNDKQVSEAKRQLKEKTIKIHELELKLDEAQTKLGVCRCQRKDEPQVATQGLPKDENS